jgi:hypothetical protein
MIIVLEPADLALGLFVLWVNDMGAEWFRQMHFIHRGTGTCVIADGSPSNSQSPIAL